MTSFLRARRFGGLCTLAVALVGFLLLTVGTEATARQAERVIYLSAVGANGMPVIDPPITAAELTVAEDNVTREIVSVTKATEPVHFAVLYETTQCDSENSSARTAGGGGDRGANTGRRCESGNNEANATNFLTELREALSGFVNVVLAAAPTSKILLMDFAGAAVVKQDFTGNVNELEPLVRKLVLQRSEPVLHEALIDAAKRLSKAPTKRRVIVTINREPSIEASRIVGKQVADDVQSSGASVWALSVRYGTRQDGARDVLLKGLAGNSGGLRLTLGTAVPLGDYLRSIAANAIVQYAVTIKRPADAPPPKLTTVKIARAGVQPLTMQWTAK